jgi:cell division protein FtsW (lipid II flippase)
MEVRMNHQHQSDTTTWWRSRSTWALLGFLAIAGFFLFTEHRAHALLALAVILLLACPLLHLFGHSGHDDGQGGHGEGHQAGSRRAGS